MRHRPQHEELEIDLPHLVESDDLHDTVLVFRNGRNEPIAVPIEVVTAAERAFRCHQLRLSGMTWEEIAIAERYPTAAAASADVRRYMEEGAALVMERSASEMLVLEVQRLDALQHAIWDTAIAGSLPAVDMVRKIIVDRAKLVGLDAEKIASHNSQEGRTVVVHSGESYTDDLRRAAAR